MKAIKNILIFAAFMMALHASLNAQTRESVDEYYVCIQVQRGDHAGETYKGTVEFVTSLTYSSRSGTSYVVYMNKAQLIDAIAGPAGLTKADNKATLVENQTTTYNSRSNYSSDPRYYLIFDDGSSVDVTSYMIEIRELHIRVDIEDTSEKKETK